MHGIAFWHKFRTYINNIIKRARSITFEDIYKYFTYEYTFYGVSYSKFFESKTRFKETLFVNIYDPEIDNTGFCDNLNDFSFIDKQWIYDNGQDLNDQNSFNFKEFVRVMLSLKDRFYKPQFRINKAKVKRGSKYIQTNDGRITIEWSEEVDILSTDYRIYLLFIALILLTFGIITPNLIVNIINVYFPDFVGFFDLCSIIGKSGKIFIRGRTVEKIIGFFSKNKKKKAVDRFLGYFTNMMKKRNKKLPLLPAAREVLPQAVRKALPRARDG